jgi:ComF family protein
MPLRPLLDALVPPACAGCGAHAGSAEPRCAACRRQLRWLAPEPAVASGVRVWAPVAYEGPAQGVVRALKFKGARRVAGAMAAQIAASAPDGWLDDRRELVPVPLHPARARKRGYNQAGLIATALAARTGLALCDCLERSGPSVTQVGRDRARRLAGISGTVGMRACPVPELAVLVDDVITTGATLSACARVLTAAGAADVIAVGYARTPGR